MDDNQLDDLKQFISATVSQATSNMASKDDIFRLETKVDELASFVAEALDNHSDVTDKQLKDHDLRLTRLESKAA